MAKRAKNGVKTVRAGNGGTIPPVEHQFKPGNPGGPGRPVTRPITEALKALSDEVLEVQAGNAKLKGSRLELLAKVAWRKALSGDFRYFKELLERFDGKVLDQLDVTTDGDKVGSGFDWLGTLSPATKAKIVKEMGGPGEE